MLSRVCVCCFSGHEVNEGLESDGSLPIGVNQRHDSGKLSFTLSQNPKQTKKNGHRNINRQQPVSFMNQQGPVVTKPLKHLPDLRSFMSEMIKSRILNAHASLESKGLGAFGKCILS